MALWSYDHLNDGKMWIMKLFNQGIDCELYHDSVIAAIDKDFWVSPQSIYDMLVNGEYDLGERLFEPEEQVIDD